MKNKEKFAMKIVLISLWLSGKMKNRGLLKI